MALSKEQLTEAIKQRAESDPVFLQKLIVDPQAAGEEVYGSALPERTKIRLAFHGTTLPANSTDTRITIWLPNPDAELSEAELEAVAGGFVGSANGSCPSANAYCPVK